MSPISRIPLHDGDWFKASNGGTGAEVVSLILARKGQQLPELHIERVSVFPENRTKWAPAESDVLRNIFEGVDSGNADFGTRFTPTHIRYEVYNTNRPEVFSRLSYTIIEAAFLETGRHDADEMDWRLPAHRLQILRDSLEHWPPAGRLEYAYGRLRRSILDSIFAELHERCHGDWQLLSIPRRTLAAVTILEGEIYNGGFDQCFSNSSGDAAHEAYEGLKLIGAPKLADILLQAMAEFPSGLPPRDQEDRWHAIKAAGERSSSEWYRLDDEFTGSYTEPALVEKLLLRYLLANADEFFVLE